LGSRRRLDWLMWVLMTKVAVSFMRRVVNKISGALFQMCARGHEWSILPPDPSVHAGLVRNRRTAKAVATAVQNAAGIKAAAVTQVSSKDLRITSANTFALTHLPRENAPLQPLPMVWDVHVDGIDSSCPCPQFGKAGVCKHTVYGLMMLEGHSPDSIPR
jgi:hypothetical protein